MLSICLSSELIHDRQQEDDLVSFIEQEESVVLDLMKYLFIFSHHVIHFIIVFQLFTLYLLVLFFYLDIVGTIEVLLFYALLHQVAGIVYYLLLFTEFTGVDND